MVQGSARSAPPSAPSGDPPIAFLTRFLAPLLVAPFAGPVAAQDLSLRLGDRLTLEPYVQLQLDAAGFRQGAGGGQAAGVNARRLRLGGRLELDEAFEFGLIGDFGGAPGDRPSLFEAKVTYTGLRPFRVTAGAFKPNFSLEGMQGSGDVLFLERASIVTMTRGLGAGTARIGVELGADGERYNASIGLTAGQAGPGRDGGQRAVVSRLAGLPVKTEDLTIHLGLSGQWIYRTASDNDGTRSLSFSDQTELRIDDVPPSLATPDIPARRAGVVAGEAGLSWRRLWVQGEYHRLLVDRPAGAGGRLAFDGWYAQAAYTVAGRPRRWQSSSGAWSAPKPAAPFDMAGGEFGAVEIGARFSAADLDSLDIRGGRQQVASAVVSWWPVEAVRLSVLYEHGRVVGGDAPRNLDALGIRAQLQF